MHTTSQTIMHSHSPSLTVNRTPRLRLGKEVGQAMESPRCSTPQGEISRNFITAKWAGFTNFALIPHANHKDRPDASFAGAEKWAAKLPVPVYAIDDHTAIKVTDDTVEVVSEGQWQLFAP